MNALFPLGAVFATPAVSEAFTEEEIDSMLHRHQHGSWGDLDDDDKAANVTALREDLRVLSKFGDVYVITEASREVTTVLFASEY